VNAFATDSTDSTSPRLRSSSAHAVAAAGRCPVCERTEFVAFRAVLFRCAHCGLVVNPDAWREGADEALEREFFDEGAYVPDESAWVRLFERLNAARTLAQLRAAGARTGRLLEVGIGSGALLVHLRDAGFDVEGCDLSESVARHARERHGLRVHVAPLERLDGAFDVIVMNHVVEHVSDPVGLLRAARERLAPGGVLHVAVPNVASWDASLPGWTSYQPYHLVYFTPGALALAARRAGLRPLRRRTNEPFSGWFLALARTALGCSPHDAVASAAAARAPSRASSPAGLGGHLYRAAMVTAGLASWPLRAAQARVGRGEEVVLIGARADVPVEGA